MKRLLLIGNTGKLGRALTEAFQGTYEIHARHAAGGFDACDFDQVAQTLREVQPDLVINAAALNGLNPCERHPDLAFHLNTMLPRMLAEATSLGGFDLVHFSSDAVFDGRIEAGAYKESDVPSPINVYGLTKLGGDCLVRTESDRHYIFRLSLLAGRDPRQQQFLEKMIAKARAGEALRIAEDIVCSPSSARDIAHAVRDALASGLPYGLYHLANAGRASLYELVLEVMRNLQLSVPISPVCHAEFPSLARKNRCTPLVSEKMPLLRDWHEAISDYCLELLREGEP